MFSFRCSVTTVCLTRKAFENNYCEKKHSWGILSPNILRIIEQFRSGRTSEGHLIQTVPQRRNNRKVSSSCSGPCSGAFWKPPRLGDKQFLCLTTHCILFFPVCLFSNRISLAATCDHCHLSFCYTTLTTAWFYFLCHLLVFLLQKGEPLASVTPLSSEIKYIYIFLLEKWPYKKLFKMVIVFLYQ